MQFGLHNRIGRLEGALLYFDLICDKTGNELAHQSIKS